MKTQVSSVPFGGAELKCWVSPSSRAPYKVWKPVLRLLAVSAVCAGEPSRVLRVKDVRRAGGCSLFEREGSWGNLPDEVGERFGILGESSASARGV